MLFLSASQTEEIDTLASVGPQSHTQYRGSRTITGASRVVLRALVDLDGRTRLHQPPHVNHGTIMQQCRTCTCSTRAYVLLCSSDVAINTCRFDVSLCQGGGDTCTRRGWPPLLPPPPPLPSPQTSHTRHPSRPRPLPRPTRRLGAGAQSISRGSGRRSACQGLTQLERPRAHKMSAHRRAG